MSRPKVRKRSADRIRLIRELGRAIKEMDGLKKWMEEQLEEILEGDGDEIPSLMETLQQAATCDVIADTIANLTELAEKAYSKEGS